MTRKEFFYIERNDIHYSWEAYMLCRHVQGEKRGIFLPPQRAGRGKLGPTSIKEVFHKNIEVLSIFEVLGIFSTSFQDCGK